MGSLSGVMRQAPAQPDAARTPPPSVIDPRQALAPVVGPAEALQRGVTKLHAIFRDFGPWTMERGTRWRDVPANYGKGVLAMGPALSGLVGETIRDIPLVIEGAQPAGAEARLKLSERVGGLGAAVVQQAGEAIRHPIRTAKQYPFELTPVAGGLTKLGAVMAGKTIVPGLEAVGQRLPGVAAMTRSLKPAVAAVAEKGPYRVAAAGAQATAEKHVPAYREWSNQVRSWKAMQEIEHGADEAYWIARNRNFKNFHKMYAGMTEAEQGEFVQTLSSLKPLDEASPRVGAAVHAWNAVPAQVQAQWVNLGKLRPDVGRRAAFQPLRIEEFGKAIPGELRAGEQRAAAEAAVNQEGITDFVRAVGEQGGAGGPIHPDRLPVIARKLKAMGLAPGRADPMKLARDIWESEAPRAARAGGYPKKMLGSFDEAVAAARKGGYVGSTAPFFHQVEAIVKAAIGGKERPLPKGLLGAPALTETPLEATSREVGRALGKRVLRRQIDKIVLEKLSISDVFPDWRSAPGREEEFVNAMQQIYEGKTPIPAEAAARVLEREEGLRRRAGQVVEGHLKKLQSKAFEARQPRLTDLVESPYGRSAWQMTREEWEALPEGARGRKTRGSARDAEDPYDFMVKEAIRRRKPVPREVLAQNPDWEQAAMSEPTRRLAAVTEELSEKIAAKGIHQPVYWPNLLDPAQFPQRVGRWTQVGGRFRPKTLRMRTGKTYAEGDYLTDPRALAAHTTQQLLAYEKAERIIESIKTDPKIGARRIKDISELKDGESAWSPDGLRLWRSEIDMRQKFATALRAEGGDAEGIEAALAKALGGMIDEDAFRAVEYGFRKPEVYAIPSSVAKHLKGTMAEAPTWVRALYDAPTGVWRMMVLALRPAWILNNIVGNVIFSTLHGVAPRHYVMALQERYIAKTPDNLNGIHLTSQEAAIGELVRGKPGDLWPQFVNWVNAQPAQVNIASTLRGFRERPLETTANVLDPRRITQPIGSMARAMTDFNQRVESFFRRANFYKDIERSARIQYLKRTGDSFLKAFDVLDEMDRLPSSAVEHAVSLTNKFMHDYAALLPHERAYLRRVFPFVNFLKFQTRLVMGLPLDFPGRYSIMQGLVAIGRDAQAYDNSQLPQWLRDKGLIDLGYDMTVRDRSGSPHRLRAFLSSTGWNPFIIGYNPASTAGGGGVSDVIGGTAGLAYSQANPLLKYPLSFLRPGYDIQSGRALTAPGIIEHEGKFYRAEELLKTGDLARSQASPPLVANPLEAIYGTSPQAQLIRHLRSPAAAYTGRPLSLEPGPREFPNRTALTELLRYFTSASIILVDQTDLSSRPISVSSARSLLFKAAAEEDRRVHDVRERQRLEVRPPAVGGAH